MNEKNIPILVAIIFAIGFVFYLLNPSPIEYNKDDKPTICTADAMKCPDGTYVGRSGPNCEFICPQTQ